MTKIKFPTNFAGIDGKKAFEEIMNKKEPEPNPNPPLPNGTSIQNHDKYEYFFAGTNEYNSYKEFVETNFPKQQKSGLQTLEELAKPSDTGMCLRTISEPNENHAKDLISQLNNKELPIYIPVISYDLELIDGKISFKITNQENILHLPILNSPNQSKFNNSDIDLQTGFPIQLNPQGARIFWTIQNGLSRCYLNRDSNLYAGYSVLSSSNDYGRVVLAKLRRS
ncbi:hypothetical protein J4481_01110 [Candidatus Pacearchaeota archaeon]|nr:hypothetical protein [Candidatus Pacearchaeota archaeon]